MMRHDGNAFDIHDMLTCNANFIKKGDTCAMNFIH